MQTKTSDSTTVTQTPEENRIGLQCRHCGCKHFRVVYTRPYRGSRIMRRRQCRNCGKRISTWESILP